MGMGDGKNASLWSLDWRTKYGDRQIRGDEPDKDDNPECEERRSEKEINGEEGRGEETVSKLVQERRRDGGDGGWFVFRLDWKVWIGRMRIIFSPREVNGLDLSQWP